MATTNRKTRVTTVHARHAMRGRRPCGYLRISQSCIGRSHCQFSLGMPVKPLASGEERVKHLALELARLTIEGGRPNCWFSGVRRCNNRGRNGYCIL